MNSQNPSSVSALSGDQLGGKKFMKVLPSWSSLLGLKMDPIYDSLSQLGLNSLAPPETMGALIH
jgi:hypothetical protein